MQIDFRDSKIRGFIKIHSPIISRKPLITIKNILNSYIYLFIPKKYYKIINIKEIYENYLS